MAGAKRKDSGQKKAQKGSQGRFEAIPRYFKDVRSEFRKVNWPTRPEIRSSTMVVLATLTFFTIFIGVLDFVFSRIVGLVIR